MAGGEGFASEGFASEVMSYETLRKLRKGTRR